MDRKSSLLAYLKESPHDPFLLYALALEYVKEEDTKAENLFNELLEKHPQYLATYYHFGKWKERKGLKDEAIALYQSGIEKAKQAKEQHTLAELQSALLELEYS